MNTIDDIGPTGPFNIQFAREGLDFEPAVIDDPVPTGEQLLALAGLRPAREHLLFHLLPDGALEEIRPDEMVDLRTPGRERFVSFRSDRSFRFWIDDEARDWGRQMVTGHLLKRIAQVDPVSHDVFHVVVGKKDQLIRDEDNVDLGSAGVERFATTRIEIEVFVNTRTHLVNRRVLDFWSVVRLEHPDADPTNLNIEYTVTYDKGPRRNPAGNLVSGQSVEIKGGMEFYVLLTDKS